jgi:hypothetical protein
MATLADPSIADLAIFPLRGEEDVAQRPVFDAESLQLEVILEVLPLLSGPFR